METVAEKAGEKAKSEAEKVVHQSWDQGMIVGVFLGATFTLILQFLWAHWGTASKVCWSSTSSSNAGLSLLSLTQSRRAGYTPVQETQPQTAASAPSNVRQSRQVEMMHI